MINIEFDTYEILSLYFYDKGMRKISCSKVTEHLLFKFPYIVSEIKYSIIRILIKKIIPISINNKKNRVHFVISKKHLEEYYNKNIHLLRPFEDVKKPYYGI